MVSVPSSYLPPLAFEPFALSEPHSHSLTLTPPSTPLPTASPHPAPTVYASPSTRIRGPRVRPKLRLVNGTDPNTHVRTGSASDSDDSGVDVQAPLGSVHRRHAHNRDTTSAHIRRNLVLAPLRPVQLGRPTRFASSAAPSSWSERRVRPGTAPVLALSSFSSAQDRIKPAYERTAGNGHGAAQVAAHGGAGTDALRAGVPIEVSEKPRTAPPAMASPEVDTAVLDLSHEDPFKWKVTGVDEHDPDTHPDLAPPPPVAVAFDDLGLSSRPDSFASSRPTSALPGATIDELEDIAEELRGMVPNQQEQQQSQQSQQQQQQPAHPPLPQETVFRGRRPIGPRPRSPPSASSAHFVRSTAASAYPSPERLDAVDEMGPSSESEHSRARSISPRRPRRDDVEWVAEYGLWCSSAKGKWKVPWVESDPEEVAEHHTVQMAEVDNEPYYTYDPHNAPEFLVGKSNSLTVTAAPGYRSARRLPRLRPMRRQPGRNPRPPNLSLAPGFLPDPDTSDDFNPPQPPAPPHSAPASHSHFPAKQHKQPDLRGLELLIGPLEPRHKPPPKPKPVPPPKTATGGGSSTLTPARREPRVDLMARTTAASWSPTTGNTPRNSYTRPSRPRRNMFASLRRWFRRLTR